MVGYTRILMLALIVGCSDLAVEHPDVLLVTVDTLRADRLGSYGHGRDTTPHFDVLASQGALFETAYAPMGTTLPSHASLFTARHPAAHTVVRNGLRLPEREATLAEVLGRHGYRTAAFVSSFPVKGRFGLDQGFDHYDDDFSSGVGTTDLEPWSGHIVQGEFDRRAMSTLQSARSWLEQWEAEGPLFVWLHLFDPHDPYKPPETYARRFSRRGIPYRQRQRRRYDAEVAYADAVMGSWVKSFESLRGRSPLLIVTSDHGEGLWDHGWALHNRHLYEEEVRVPMLWRWPGHIPPGRRIEQPAHLVDVMPTLLALLGIDAPEKTDGLDLSPFLVGAPAPTLDRPIWLQQPRGDEAEPGLGFGVRVGPWKLIERLDGTVELYDLSQDPDEKLNLASKRPDQVRALSQRLASWRARQEELRGSAVSIQIDPEDERALRALGYLHEPEPAE